MRREKIIYTREERKEIEEQMIQKSYTHRDTEKYIHTNKHADKLVHTEIHTDTHTHTHTQTRNVIQKRHQVKGDYY